LFTKESEVYGGSADAENYSFARNLISGVSSYLEFLDRAISSASTHWNLGRMSRVDRNILRIAAYEIGFLADVPASVSINEAIEVAKRYGADDSPMFVNGVLDNLAQMFRSHPEMVVNLLEDEEKAVANG